MVTDELKLDYDDPKLCQRLRQFALDHPSSKWKQFARLNRNSIVVAAASKKR